MSSTIQEIKEDLYDALGPTLHDGSLKSFKLCISAVGEVWIDLISSIIVKKSENIEEFIRFFDEALLEMDTEHKRWIKEIANAVYEGEK